MGNRFGIHGLEAASAHSERDVDVGRLSNRPIEVPVTEARSDFGSSCPDPEVSQTKVASRHTIHGHSELVSSCYGKGRLLVNKLMIDCCFHGLLGPLVGFLMPIGFIFFSFLLKVDFLF